MLKFFLLSFRWFPKGRNGNRCWLLPSPEDDEEDEDDDDDQEDWEETKDGTSDVVDSGEEDDEDPDRARDDRRRSGQDEPYELCFRMGRDGR